MMGASPGPLLPVPEATLCSQSDIIAFNYSGRRKLFLTIIECNFKKCLNEKPAST